MMAYVRTVFQMPDIALSDLTQDDGFKSKPVARQLSGRPLSQTPAVKEAERAHIECDVNVDSLAYWNDPQGDRDQSFKSPFAVKVRKHIVCVRLCA